jgi:hypothetical protein
VTATRDAIERTLRTMNEVENALDLSPAEKSAAIDPTHRADVRAWRHGIADDGREKSREEEAWLFSTFPDYHRNFDHVVIDPPYAAVAWFMTGTNVESGEHLGLPGATFFRFDDEGRVAETWMFLNDPTAEVADDG